MAASASTTSLRTQSVLTLWPDDPLNTRLYSTTGECQYPPETTTRITRLVVNHALSFANSFGGSTTGSFSAREHRRVTEVEVATIRVPPGDASDPAAHFDDAVVTFGQGAPVPLRNWLPWGCAINPRCDEFFRLEDAKARRYEWRARYNRDQFMLEMYAWDTPGVPIARYTRAFIDFENSDGTLQVDSSLTLTARAKEVEDLVVASCLTLERMQRPSSMSGMAH
ncbi:hypothetical protein BKA62DRAFT_751723 [Auriculariales sp. MPI-PUGE-AT-0066]|nr:hypothetical protein BKA62DRAFT_751723 [Auriculariales sp. MPI-PUGE-AT-0066]